MFIPKAHKAVTDQELEETQTKFSQFQEDSTHETTGNNIIFLVIHIYLLSPLESPPILELKDQLKGSGDNKEEISHPSKVLC